MKYSTPSSRPRRRRTYEDKNDDEIDDKSTSTPITDAIDSVRQMTMTILGDVDLDMFCGRAMNSIHNMHGHNRHHHAWAVSHERRIKAVRKEYFRPLTNVVVGCDAFEHCDVKKFFKLYFGSERMGKFHLERGDKDVTFQRWKNWRGQSQKQNQQQNEMDGDKASPGSPSLITKNMPIHILWGGPVLERTITFHTPVKVPMGPKLTEVTILQRLLRVAEEMYIIESCMQLMDVPFSERFHIVIRQTIESDRSSQKQKGSAKKVNKAGTKENKGAKSYGRHDSIEDLQSLPFFGREDVKQQQHSKENRSPPDLQPVSSDESEEDDEDDTTEEEEFRLVPPTPTITTLRVEFEIRFTKSCKFEDRIRHSLTKKIGRLLASWCHKTQEDWNELTNGSPPLPVSPTSVITPMKQVESPPVPIPTVPRDLSHYTRHVYGEHKKNEKDEHNSQQDPQQRELGANDEKEGTRSISPQARWQKLHHGSHHDHISLVWSMTDIDVDDLEDLYDVVDDDSTTVQRQQSQTEEESGDDDNGYANEFKLMEWRSDTLSEIGTQDICSWDEWEKYDNGDGYGVEVYDRGNDVEEGHDEDLESSQFVWNTSSEENKVLTYERLLELVRAGLASSICYGPQCDVEVVYVVDDDDDETGEQEKTEETEDSFCMNRSQRTEMDEERNIVATHATDCVTNNKNTHDKDKVHKRYIVRLLKEGKIRKFNSNQVSFPSSKKLPFSFQRKKVRMVTNIPVTAAEL